MTADTAARKDERPVKAWTVFPRRFLFSRDNAPCPPNRRGGRRYALTVGVAMESAQPFGRYGRKNVKEARQVSVSRLFMVRAWRRIAGVRVPLPLILSRENRRTRVLATAMDVVGTAEFSGLCPPSSNFFDREQSPYGIVLTSKNKRDRNKAMTGKARIFRVCGVFNGLFPEKSAGNVFLYQRAYCAHSPERFHAIIKE